MPREEEAEGGLGPEVIIHALYLAYRQLQDVLGNQTPEPDELPPDHVDGWMAAVNAGTPLILDSEDKGGITWRQIATEMHNAFAEATDARDEQGNHLTFAKLPEVLHLMWEALARHLSNMAAYDKTDPDGEIEEHIDKIAGWFQVKINELGERLINESDSEGKAGPTSPLALAASQG